MLEFSMYEDIPHLLTPVVTDVTDSGKALRWCVGEMERRYKLMSTLNVRSLTSYNQKVNDAIKVGAPIENPFFEFVSNSDKTSDVDTSDEVNSNLKYLQPLPKIVVVIDELADLMMVVGKKIESLIARLAQKARAAGIHLILATQRPSVDVITGLIKANIPARISFQVSSRVDSRTVLDQMGAETLLGQGDMLFLMPGSGLPKRIHGAFVADEEVLAVVDYIKKTAAPEYDETILKEPFDSDSKSNSITENGSNIKDNGEKDPLYDEAVAIIFKNKRASISLVQRHLRIGYNRAARLLDAMESAGIVSEMGSNGNREILFTPEN
jgi:S-DNA-T family DNA segregation ATPase FtsK/SpoIIIE